MQLPNDLLRSKLRTNIRPPKVAYFFDEDDDATLLHLLRLAVTDWGGIYNYLLPVRADDTIALGLADIAAIHPPEFFHSYLPTINENPFSGARRAAAIASKQFGAASDKVVHGPFFESRANGMHPLSVMPRWLVNPPNSFHPDGIYNKLTSYAFPPDNGDLMYLLAAFGEIPPAQRQDYEKLCLIHERPISLEHADLWTMQRISHAASSPVNLTGCNLGPSYVANGWSSLPFYIVVASCASTVCYYWNLRAIREAAQFDRIGRRTILLPARIAKDPNAVTALLNAIREAPFLESESCEIDFVITCGFKEEREAIESTLKIIPGIIESAAKKITSHSWMGHKGRVPREADRSRTLEYLYTGSPPVPLSLLQGVPNPVEPTNVALTFGENEVSFVPPASFENRFAGTAVVDLQSDLWERYPRSADVATSIRPAAWWTQYGLSFLVSAPTRSTYLNLSLPSEWQALRLHFGSLGYDIAQSQNGRYADAVVRLLGGLRGASVLASQMAYRVLEKLTLPSTKKIAQRILKDVKVTDVEELIRALREPEVVEELKNVCKTFRQLYDSLRHDSPDFKEKDLLPLLNELSAAGVVRRGFFLACPHCGTPNWHSLEELREHLICPGCSHKFHLPVERPYGEIRWEYRLNSLVNRAMDQDSLPAILALHHIQKSRSIFGATPGVELQPKRQNDVAAEFDFVFVWESKVCAGECKAGTEIGEKDKKAARVAADLGVAEYFFCTPQNFSAESQLSIAGLAEELKDRMPVTMLESKALLGT